MNNSQHFSANPSFPCGKIERENLPFKDVRVRQAMNLAIDQKDMLENYYEGEATMLGCPFLTIPSFASAYVPLEEMPAVRSGNKFAVFQYL